MSAPPPRLSPLTLALAVTALIGAMWAYVDLRTEVAELRGRVHTLEQTRAPVATPPPAPTAPAAPAAPRPAATTPAPPTQPLAGPASPAAADPSVGATRPNRDTWRCPGQIPSPEVQRVVGLKGPPLYECWSRFARGAPPTRARVLLRVAVGGQVTDAHVTGLQAARAAERCIGQEALTWQFAARPGDGCAVVDLPFRFGDSR